MTRYLAIASLVFVTAFLYAAGAAGFYAARSAGALPVSRAYALTWWLPYELYLVGYGAASHFVPPSGAPA